jgi:hypothetical protein
LAEFLLLLLLLFAFFINLAVVATNSAVRRSAFPSLDLWVGLS